MSEPINSDVVRIPCALCGMIITVSPAFHAERYGHSPETIIDGVRRRFSFEAFAFVVVTAVELDDNGQTFTVGSVETHDGQHLAVTPHGKFLGIHASVDDAGQALVERWMTCAWFARCTNRATVEIPHPVLGPVRACDRCKAIHDGASVARG